MPPLVDNVLRTMRNRVRSHEARACVVCGDRVEAGDAELKVRGMRVHRGCATYRTRRRGSVDAGRR